MKRNNQFQYVPIDSLKPDPNQPRKTWKNDELIAHGHSYKIHGVINPIEVDEDMMIITGESRWRSAKLVGLTEVPVITISSLTKEERFYRQGAENLARTDLTTQEQKTVVMRVWEDVVKEMSLSTSGQTREGRPTEVYYSEVARRLGITKEWVRTLVDDIGKADPKIQELFEKGEIHATSIREIRKLKNPSLEVRVAKKASITEGENLKRDDVATIIDAIQKFPEKTEQILSETYPPKHDDLVRAMDNITGRGKKLKTVPLTDEEKIRSWAKELSAKITDALELMYSLPVKELNPHTLAMLYDQTVRLPAFILNFHDKVIKFNEKVAKALDNKTLTTIEFKELK